MERLSLAEREEISRGLARDESLRSIASQLGRGRLWSCARHRRRTPAVPSVKIKTDENIPTRVIGLLRENDQDVATVRDEHLVGASDRRLAEVATDEGRILLTLDRGFADVRLYPPGTHPGIFVIHARELRVGDPGIRTEVRGGLASVCR